MLRKYSPLEKAAFILPLLYVLIFYIPVSFYPTSMLKEDTEMSKLLTQDLKDYFDRNGIVEMTNTTFNAFFLESCVERRTIIRTDEARGSGFNHAFWVKGCISDNPDEQFNFRLINEGDRLALYTSSHNRDLAKEYRRRKSSFLFYMREPLKAYTKENINIY